MPNYEYECKKCGHRFEEIRKFSDKHPKKCPECGGAIEQVISAPAVQFKGSGWYVTDYAKKSSGSAGSSPATSASESDSTAKETKDTRDSKETKDTKKDDKPKSEASSKKHKKD
jgi:putative FmdB family regulatory protein